MTNANDVRKAHDVLDGLFAGRILSKENEQLLRSFLPELPKQKTLEEIGFRVYDAWIEASGNEWGGNSYDPDVSIEDWLGELHVHLKGLMDTPAAEPANPTHPEFLEIEADYRDAPEGTIVVSDGGVPCHKFQSKWSSVAFLAMKDNRGMSRACRRVLRWGDGE